MDIEPEVRAVVDASAVLAWVFNERGAEIVDQVLSVSGISAVNLSEVLYKCAERRVDPEDTEADLADYGLTLLPFRGAEARQVVFVRQAEEKAGVNLSLADRCCIATGLVWRVPVVASDNAWEQLGVGLEVTPFR
ncbi:MAG: PIN domain-containing protein [Actinomycetota bacterium]